VLSQHSLRTPREQARLTPHHAASTCVTGLRDEEVKSASPSTTCWLILYIYWSFYSFCHTAITFAATNSLTRSQRLNLYTMAHDGPVDSMRWVNLRFALFVLAEFSHEVRYVRTYQYFTAILIAPGNRACDPESLRWKRSQCLCLLARGRLYKCATPHWGWSRGRHAAARRQGLEISILGQDGWRGGQISAVGTRRRQQSSRHALLRSAGRRL